MPASLTHLYTGRAVIPLLSPESLPQYYLGCVLPDAVNLDGFASKEIRTAAHLREESLKDWMENIIRFVKKTRKREGEQSLLWGYAVHLIGDLVWDEFFEEELRRAVDDGHLSREERFARRWAEHYFFEQQQLSAPWWRDEVRPLLNRACPQAINGIPAELASRYRDYLTAEYAPVPQREPQGYVTLERVDAFGKKIAKKLKSTGLLSLAGK